MKGKRKTSRADKKRTPPVLTIAVCSVLGSALYFIAAAVFAALSLKFHVDSKLYLPAGAALGALTGWIGGFCAAKPQKEKGAVYGAASGAGQAVVTAVILFAVNEGETGVKAALLFSLTVIFGIIGGIAAVNVKRKKKY